MKNSNVSITDQKAKGRFYTPGFIVSNILDLTGYAGLNILGKHIIDNSCGGRYAEISGCQPKYKSGGYYTFS